MYRGAGDAEGAAALVLAAAAATGGVVAMSGAGQAIPAAQEPPVNTATVERGKLSDLVSRYGTLTYRARSDGSPYSVINRARGIYTKLPDGGDRVDCGEVIYRVNDNPVLLLCGSTPAYRSLSGGDSGPDVTELNANLVHLGYATRAQLDPSSHDFRSATASALRKLQSRLGEGQTGSLESRSGGVPARVGAGRQGDRRARRHRPGRFQGLVRHIRHARGAVGPRSVAAG